MKIEIYGALFKNKGAELMLRAICKRIEEETKQGHGVVEFSIKQFFNTEYNELLYRRFPSISVFSKFIPRIIRKKLRIITENELSYIFDASGFAYGDQWGLASSTYFLQKIKKWKKMNLKIIMLPQAFGPFTKEGLPETMIKIHNEVEHIFVRDKVSLKYLKDLIGNSEKISLAPDFTNLISGTTPDSFNNKNGVAIIPNYRMIDKTNSGQEYKMLIKNSIKHLQYLGETPFFLIHEGNDDFVLANEINNELNTQIPVYFGCNALEIKGIIGQTKMVISSRFHGLVSALSQGVPSLGTGWSHKYECLFKDYNYEKGILYENEWKDINKKIEQILDKNNYNQDVTIINNKSIQLKKESENMWKKVFEIINTN